MNAGYDSEEEAVFTGNLDENPFNIAAKEVQEKAP